MVSQPKLGAWNVGYALTTSGQPLFGFSCRLIRAGES
jgi:hypothetical protein